MNYYHPTTNALIQICETVSNASTTGLLYALNTIPYTIASEPTYDEAWNFAGYMDVLLFSLQQSGTDVIAAFPATSNGQPSPLIVAGNLRSDIQTILNTYTPLPQGVHYIHGISSNVTYQVTLNFNGTLVLNQQLVSARNKNALISAIATEISNATGETWIGTPTQFDCSSMQSWNYGVLVLKNNLTGATENINPLVDPLPTPPII